ncbi:MAG: TadE/TadG family type IV pilus assembly protein [Hyphomonadaceae bacterium]
MKALLPFVRKFTRARGGAALVEFTLVAPLLLMLMCGMAEFANAMRQYHIMEKGVRDAGRYLARVPMTGCTVSGTATTAARNLALTGRTSGGSYLLPTWNDLTTVTVTIPQCFDNSAGAYRGRAQIPILEVTASAPYVDLGLLSMIGLGDINLEVSHQQYWVGE